MKVVKILCNFCMKEGSVDNPIGGYILEEDDKVKLVTCVMADFHLCGSCIEKIGNADRSKR